MSADPSARILTIAGVPAPVVHERAFVAAGAVIVGDVRLEAGSASGTTRCCAPRPSRSGPASTRTCRTPWSATSTAGFPLTIGRSVSVGHGAVLHGCTVEDDCLIGMAATVLNGAVIGSGSLVAAGTIVLEGTVVPPGSLVAGVPAKVRRELTDAERDGIRRNAAAYLRHVEEHPAPVD